MSLEEAAAIAREVARDIVAEHAPGVDREAKWPREGIQALLAAGLGGLVVPRDSGGLGLGLAGLMRVCEEIGAECGSTAVCFGMHAVGAAVISAKPTDEQRERLVAPITRGEHITTLALSEPATGVDFQFPQTRFQTNGHGGFTLSGTKCFVTNGGEADSYVVSGIAVGDGEETRAQEGGFSCMLVPADEPGLVWRGEWQGVGLRGNSSRTVDLDGTRVPKENLLGQEGDELWYVFHVVLPYFLTAMTGSYLGIARAALEEALASVGERRYEHSGAMLSDAPVVQHDLGRLWANVERTRRLAYFAGREADAAGPHALPAMLSAKAEVADCAVHVTNEAMTLMGGRAFAEGTRIQRLLRDARAAHVMSPTTQIVRIWCGRYLLDRPLLG